MILPLARPLALARRSAAPLLGAALVAALAQPLLAQQTGAIAGTVVAANGQPLSGANVQAQLDGRPSAGVNVRDDGTFRMDGLAPGRYVVTARRVSDA